MSEFSLIEEIKEKISITDILEKYGIYPAKNKTSYVCCFHKDSRPSASTSRGIFFCFTCGKGWDTIDFVCEIEKCDRKKAIKIIDEKFGLGLFKPLSKAEKEELEKSKRKREQEQLRKQWWLDFEKQIINEISTRMRIYEKLKQISSVTKNAYNGKGEWKMRDSFFLALKKLEWLDWLFDVITEQPHQECEYDFIYGTSKKELIKCIWKMKIII